ncbi:MAG: XdhC family protein [Lachnospiraceae bacterium]|nr:XdhC family protein [Lachnospiraceae bacterium]
MKNLFTRILYALEEEEDLVLAVIIADQGSSPRGKGSAMLVARTGQLMGTIGGGAVEKRSELRAMELIGLKQSEVHAYQLHQNKVEDIGMVCGGDVDVLFQFIDAHDGAWKELAGEVLRRIDEKEAGALVFRRDFKVPELVDFTKMCPSDQAAVCDDPGVLYIMPLPVMERAVIFGAGHCARALAPILESVGFRTVIYDNREEMVSQERFPGAEERICSDFARISDSLQIREDDYVVIMTSGHAHDCTVEEQILRLQTAYVGVIGSRRKTEAVNKRLRAAGIPEEAIESVHTPIGLAIKAVTPEEIAVSIAGEMILIRAQKREQNQVKQNQ